MSRTILVMLAMVSIIGCVKHNTFDNPSGNNNFIKVARIGTHLQERGNEVYISELDPNMPAIGAGMRPGDTVLTLDERKIRRAAEFRSYLNNKAIGEHVLISVRRDKSIITFDIEPTFIKVHSTQIKIDSLLTDNNRMALAIIVSEVKNATLDKSAGTYESWVASIRSSLQSYIESDLLKGYGNDKLFSIVDRNRLKQLLDEYSLSQVGLISDKLRVQISEMTGATHILDVSLSRFSHDSGFEDIENRRLIDIKTGNVLAVDTMSHYLSHR